MTARSLDRSGVAVATSLFVITVAVFVRVPILPEIGRDLELSATGIGALGSSFALGRLVTDFPAGRLVDRFSARTMMAGSALVVFAGSVILAVSPIRFVAFFGFFVLGIGSATTLTTAMAHFASAPNKRRGVALSVFAAALLVGQAIGPTVGGLIAPRFGWRAALWAVAVLVVVVGLPLARMGTPTEKRIVETAAGSGTTLLVRIVIYALPAAQFAIGAAVLQTLIPIVADKELGYGAAAIGLALGLGGLVRLVAAVTTGQISDRVGRRWALIPGLVFQLAGVIVLMVWEGPGAWLITIVLLTFGSISVNVGTTMLADLADDTQIGSRLGAFRFAGDVGFIVAPLVAGALYDASGRTVATLPFVVTAAAVLIAATLWLPETLER